MTAGSVVRLSPDPATEPGSLPLREGRVIRWLEDALHPLRRTHPASTSTGSPSRRLGIESLVRLTDVAGLDRDQAVQLVRETAHAVLAARHEGSGRRRRRQLAAGRCGGGDGRPSAWATLSRTAVKPSLGIVLRTYPCK